MFIIWHSNHKKKGKTFQLLVKRILWWRELLCYNVCTVCTVRWSMVNSSNWKLKYNKLQLLVIDPDQRAPPSNPTPLNSSLLLYPPPSNSLAAVVMFTPLHNSRINNLIFCEMQQVGLFKVGSGRGYLKGVNRVLTLWPIEKIWRASTITYCVLTANW